MLRMGVREGERPDRKATPQRRRAAGGKSAESNDLTATAKPSSTATRSTPHSPKLLRCGFDERPRSRLRPSRGAGGPRRRRPPPPPR
jgi:hypothetical protein